MKAPGISDVILTVSNLDRSRKFYGDLLGFEIQDVKFEDAAIWVLIHPETSPDDRFSEFCIGLDHLSFNATNEAELQTMADKLIAAGVNTKGVETFFIGNKYIAFR